MLGAVNILSSRLFKNMYCASKLSLIDQMI